MRQLYPRLLIFFGFAGIAAIFGCKKDQHYTIDSGLKAAFAYMPGTYWIYKDSLTGRVDSFYVVSNELSTFNYPSQGYSQDEFDIDIIEKSIIPITAQDVYDTSHWRLSLTDKIGLGWYNNNLPEAGVGFTLSKYPFAPGTVGSFCYVANIYPSYAIGSNTFSNVEETISSFGSKYNYNDTFYLTTDYGLVKLCLHHHYDSLAIDRTWELQRSYIIK